jgi:hypothetical protein
MSEPQYKLNQSVFKISIFLPNDNESFEAFLRLFIVGIRSLWVKEKMIAQRLMYYTWAKLNTSLGSDLSHP